MPIRIPVVFLLLLTLTCPAPAKNKKKQELPDIVLNARMVFVVIHPDAGEPITDPAANRSAREAVERALSKWGRFDLAMTAQTADLIIAVQKGHAGGPTIGNSPEDNRSITLGPSEGRVSVGSPPDLTNPGPGPQNSGPHISNQIGPSEDTFEVYLGGNRYPLDAPPIWRYRAKNSLNEPQVAAVERFRKAIEDSERQRQGKP